MVRKTGYAGGIVTFGDAATASDLVYPEFPLCDGLLLMFQKYKNRAQSVIAM
jgi:hypothetical protein